MKYAEKFVVIRHAGTLQMKSAGQIRNYSY